MTSLRARTLLVLVVLGGVGALARPVAAQQYQPGSGAVSFYQFVDEPLNDRMGLRINVASGNLLLTASDLGIAGTGLDLNLERYYNSVVTGSGSFGHGWRFNLGTDVKLTTLADGNVEFTAPSHFRAVFRRQADGTFTPPTGFHARLAQDAGGAWTITYNQSQVKLTFAAAGGTLSSIIDKNGNQIDPSNDATGRMYDVVDSQGRRTTFQYDGSNRITLATDPSGRTLRYAYNTAGDLTTYTDPAGKLTRYVYDSSHRLTEIVDPVGHKTKIAYDASRRVTSFTRVTNTSAGTGPTTRFAYGTGDGRCPAATTSTSVTDANGNPTVYCWDVERRVKKVIDARGNDEATTYDVDSNVTELATGSSTSTATWLEGGRMETVTNPTGGKLSYSYGDTAHRFFPTSMTNPQGRTTSFTWQNNNLSRVTDGDQKQTNLTYNVNGTVATSTAPKGTGLPEPNPHKTTYTYDAKGNLIRVAHPAPLAAETLAYDGLSRLVTRTDGKGQRQVYAYDALDRITRVEFRKESGTVESTVTYGYDGNGNRTTRTGATGTTTYTYDSLNRLTSELLPLPSGTSQTYAYDNVGNLVSYSDGGGTVGYGYDAVNNLTRLTEPHGALTTFGYDARDNRTLTSYPNGVSIASQFDLADRVTSITARRGTAPPIADLTYSYDPDGGGPLIDSELRSREQNRVANTTTDYLYDAADRLREAHTFTTGTSTTRDRFTYTYDANSNRTSQVHNGAQTSYAYNTANQLCWTVAGSSSAACGSPPAGATTYTYDPNGNELSNSAGRTLGYNAKDQLTTSRGAGQTYTETFTFAGADQWERVRATGHPDDSFSYTNSPLGVMSLRGDGGFTARYVRDDDGALVSITQSGVRRYFVADALGSIVALTTSTGAVDGAYRYDPYGNTLSSSGTRQPWGFAGEYLDTNGLYKMGMRWYDPRVGRWTQTDPSGWHVDVRQANAYIYAANDPVNYADPEGEFAFVLAAPAIAISGKALAAAAVTTVAVTATAAGIYYAKEHRKGKRPSTRDKHTKPRPGRGSEKKRSHESWKQNPNKRKNR
jgi:RHS repeat-associated protein